jgi:hypothetical protein
MLQTLLGSCCPHTPASSPSSSSSNVRPQQHHKTNYYTPNIITHSEFQAARADFQMPILCCVYLGHSSCLHVMRSYLGSRLLYRLCFTESGEIHDDDDGDYDDDDDDDDDDVDDDDVDDDNGDENDDDTSSPVFLLLCDAMQRLVDS